MSAEQRQLWRQTAILGFVLGLVTLLNFTLTVLGFDLNADYLDRVLEGYYEPLIDKPQGDRVLYWAGFMLVAFSFPYFLRAFVAMQFTHALVVGQHRLLSQFMLMLATVNGMLSVLMGITGVYSAVYAPDAETGHTFFILRTFAWA
jgi:hypothetical protein